MSSRLVRSAGQLRVPARVLGALPAALVSLVTGALIGVVASRSLPPSLSSIFQLGVLAAFALGAVVLTWRRPVAAVVAILVVVPLQPLVFARLWSLGLDLRLLNGARFWKELVIAVIAARAFQRWRDWTGLDRLILVFLALTLLYVLLPIGPPLFERMLGARLDAAFLLLFLAVRHAPGLDDARGKVEATILLMGSVAALVALWNWLSPEAYSNWFASTKVLEYRSAALDVTTPFVFVAEQGRAVRVGSFFGNFLALAFYLVVPCGLVIGRLMRSSLRRWDVVAGVLCSFGLLLTLTRSAIATLPLMAILALLVGRNRGRLTLFIFSIGAVAVMLLPVIPGSERLGLKSEIAAGSTEAHLAGLRSSTERLGQVPLGTGLGTAGPLILRNPTAGGVINENWYFQIGTEIGVAGLLLFVAIVLWVLKALADSARRGKGLALGPLCALAGVAAAGLVLHTFGDIAIAWTVWLPAGLALRPNAIEESAPSVPQAA